MGDNYYNVSGHLFHVLDWIGVSGEMRVAYKEMAMTMEILDILVEQSTDDHIHGVYTYIFGSSCEGTTTPAMNSDIDVLLCSNEPVVEKITDAPHYGKSLVMVRDGSVKPGYVKLQNVYNGVPLTIYRRETTVLEDTDQQGRICMKHWGDIINDPLFDERNGPAASRTGLTGRIDTDYVPAYRYPHIPSFAQSWISRQRRYSWPHPHQIDKMKNNGCFFVGVNHPASQNGPIEWRVSYSLQERELMLNLNPTQHKCYVLLKVIKKDIIHKAVPKSISSYHCKTCLFNAIENTPAEFWTRRNLLECARVCTKLLLQWVRERNCPNYFIPDENMFERLRPETLRQVKAVLEGMLAHWCSFLWSLTCDGIRDVLYAVLFVSGPGALCVRNENVIEHRLSIYNGIQRSIYDETLQFIKKSKRMSSIELFKRMYRFKLKLKQTDRVTEHTKEDTRLVIAHFMPHLHLQIAQCLASILLNTRDERLTGKILRVFTYCISGSRDCDPISSNLIVASLCLQLCRFENCEKFLFACEIALGPHVTSQCCCERTRGINRDESWKKLVHHLNSENRLCTFKQFRLCTTGCLTFLRCQSNLVPAALQYEMYRSANTPPDSRDDHLDACFDWIVVDSKVYLFFLQYILYTKTNKPVCKQNAMDKLVHVIRTHKNIGHRETAYNLLGWIYRQEHEEQQAMECFLNSRRSPNHN